jgi:phage gp45-like
MIIWAKITQAGNSAANWFRQQITYKEKVSNCAVIYPYGFHANAVPNESLALVFMVGCNAQNKVGIAYNPNKRPDLKEGEVAVYQPTTNTEIKIDQSGNIIITTDNDVVLNSDNININSGDITLNGNVAINGDLSITGSVTNDSTNIGKGHLHTLVTEGTDNSGPPVP